MNHLAPGRGRWRLWRWCRLRSAGFPLRLLDGLAVRESAALADRLISSEAEVAAAQAGAVAAIDGVALGGLSPDDRKRMMNAARRARAGRWDGVETPAGLPSVKAAVDAWRAAASEAHAIAEAFERSYAIELDHTRVALRSLFGDPRLREAVWWQSDSADGAIAELVAEPPGARNKRARGREQLAAMYLQRYCAKNDTIGFFGPIAFGTVGREGPAISYRPPAEPIVERRVYFEHWAMRALADRAAADPNVAPEIPLRRSPRVRLDGDVLCYPIDQRSELAPECARLIELCDGTRDMAALAERLVGEGPERFANRAELQVTVDDLVAQAALLRQIELTTSDFHPERSLRRALESLPSARGFLALLDELEALRRRLEASRDPDERRLLRRQLDQRFEEVTGTDSTRNAGKTYAGRAIVYEDCLRDAGGLDLGGDLIARLLPVLELVLESGHAYAAEVGATARRLADQLYQELVDGGAGPTVDYTRFLTAFKRRLTPEIADAATARLQEAWRAALAIDGSEARVERRLDQLAQRLAPSLAGRRANWPHAIFQSPDLLIAASSAEAVARGDYLVVLGELHANANTVNSPLAIKLLPEREELAAALSADCPRLVAPVIEERLMFRAASFLVDGGGLIEIEMGKTRSRLPRERVVELGELTIARRGAELRVATRDGRIDLSFEEVIDSSLAVLTGAGLDLITTGAHTPRVTVDGVVLAREKWIVPPPALPPAVDDVFLALRRWARAAGLPRRVFVKVKEETKPFFVDFDSPLLVEKLAKIAGHAASLTVSEMLPDGESLWLRDRDGAGYTSELRLVAVRTD